MSEKEEYVKKGNILGQFGRQMSGQLMIFPLIQYSLIFNIHLYMIWHIMHSPTKQSVTTANSVNE